MQCPQGGAVLRETLLRPPERAGRLSSRAGHRSDPRGGALSVPTGGPAAGDQKIHERQRWDEKTSANADSAVAHLHHHLFILLTSRWLNQYFVLFVFCLFFHRVCLESRGASEHGTLVVCSPQV